MSLCLLAGTFVEKTSSSWNVQVADLLPDRVMEAQFGHWQNFSISVWLKLEDTTKQARRQFNCLVRL